MGLGGISIWQLLIIFAIIILLFGTKKLSGLGADLGNAIKGFRKAMNENDDKKSKENKKQPLNMPMDDNKPSENE